MVYVTCIACSRVDSELIYICFNCYYITVALIIYLCYKSSRSWQCFSVCILESCSTLDPVLEICPCKSPIILISSFACPASVDSSVLINISSGNLRAHLTEPPKNMNNACPYTASMGRLTHYWMLN